MERKEQKPGRVTTPYIVVMEGDKLVCVREYPVQVMFRGQAIGKFALDLVVHESTLMAGLTSWRVGISLRSGFSKCSRWRACQAEAAIG